MLRVQNPKILWYNEYYCCSDHLYYYRSSARTTLESCVRGDNSVAYPHGDRNKGRPARMASLREPTCTVSTLKIVHVGIFWKPMHTDGQSEGSCTCMDSSGSMCGQFERTCTRGQNQGPGLATSPRRLERTISLKERAHAEVTHGTCVHGQSEGTCMGDHSKGGCMLRENFGGLRT